MYHTRPAAIFYHQLHPLLLTFLSLICTSSVAAALVNVTVDDSQTDNGSLLIQYTPADLWNNGPTCTACTAHPDSANMSDSTWHDSTHAEGAGSDGLPFASLQFSGKTLMMSIQKLKKIMWC